ncbi:alpha/beta hydrolase fold [Leptothrix cholodnii SP-6]|uniref:Alpha/beta hydrolase fold n=1 Tax=Leptothrix cholodnii (strain ATCC 51168 / LMG 8142 / SP-6) TaxID=395495 RepID=B1Y5X8_LEPCP|nr:alpha/beta fold hydrolase [Leptothrix cholodnii]ACB32325.1 alpha/beta hydrolase fold [Leptothrix cholodnii SP-6]
MSTGLARFFAAVLPILFATCSTAHWPDQPPHQMARLGEFKFERGGSIPDLRISYVTHGKLNEARDNAVLLMHGYGGNHHVYDLLIGPGRAFDTDRYFFICPDALGATQTGPEHSSSATSSGLRMAFPKYNIRDLVEAQHRLVTQVFGVTRLLAVAGASSGGSFAVQYAVRHPQAMTGIVPIVGGAFAGVNSRLRRPWSLSVIESCAGWEGGNYEKNPQVCATNALMVQIPYFYSRDWWERNLDTPEAFERWRVGFGAFYIDVQDTRDLWYLNQSYGNGWIHDTPGFGGDVRAALASIRARALYIHVQQDEIFPPEKIAAEVALIPGARALKLDSIAGHTVWYNADPQATVVMSNAIRAFLAELAGSRASAESPNSQPPQR